jgi:flagellar capping protein FliD
MANSISGTSSIYGVNNIYGINSYKNYLTSIAGKRTNTLSNVLNGAVASSVSANVRSGSTQSSSNSYLAQLNNSINSMYMANTSLALSSKKVASTNTAAITGTAQMNAAVKNYTIKVSALASNQVNKGTELAADSKSLINAGFNTLKIKSGSSERNVYFTINENDTNKIALNKMATAINKSDAGIKATVQTGSNDSVYLKLEATKTGSRNSFSVTDQRGNATTTTAIGTEETKAQDSVYSVDGRQYTSSGNTVSMDNGKVQATLKKADNTEVELNVAPDTANSTLPDFYSYFNNLLSSGNYYSSRTGSGSMFDMLL